MKMGREWAQKFWNTDKKIVIREIYNISLMWMVPIIIWKLVANQSGVSHYYAFCNLLLIFLVELTVFTIIRSACFSTCITSVVISVLYIVNDIVTQLRGTPFTARDIFSFRTAMSVSEDYLPNLVIKGDISNRILSMLAIILVVTVIAFLLRKQIRCNHRCIKITERAISLVACLILICFIAKIDTNQWDMSAFWHQSEANMYGSILCFYKECKELKVSKPDGYDRKAVETALSCYEDETGGANTPDIIVIMNEAWADFSIFSGYSEMDIEPLPYIHNEILKGNLDSGYIHTSVWGGDTANTEWEFLTYNSMINCQGGIPYNQYINHSIETVVTNLHGLGYSSLAVHPFYAGGYSRSQVYDFMGFDRFVSLLDFDERYEGLSFCESLTEGELEDSPDGMYIRNRISDESLFEKTIELYDESVIDGEPVFIFDVTMQNHGAYTYDNYIGKFEACLTGNTEIDEQLSQYLSLEYETDKAFERLISYYENVDRDVMIVMFGDHQPALDISIYNCLLNKEINADENDWTEDEKNMRYIVPYVVWTNFETSLDNNYENLSANYLALMVNDYAELPYDSKTQYMNELYQKYPVITANEVVDTDGNYISPNVWNVPENDDAWFYKELQYYYMFDLKVKK